MRDFFKLLTSCFHLVRRKFRNIILESLLCATPVLINIGGPDIVEDGVNGSLVKSIDSENFSKELSKLLLGSGLKELQDKTEGWSRVNRQKY